MTTNPAYERLPGAGLRRGAWVSVFGLRSRLFLGPDHLLLVDSTGWREDYKRFYFADIQALTVAYTRRGQVLNAVLSVAGSLLGLAGYFVPFGGGTLVFGALAGVVLVALVANLVQGPTAVTTIRTAVQIDELASLNRLRRTRRVLARLRPLIEAAQTEPPATRAGYPQPDDAPLR